MYTPHESRGAFSDTFATTSRLNILYGLETWYVQSSRHIQIMRKDMRHIRYFWRIYAVYQFWSFWPHEVSFIYSFYLFHKNGVTSYKNYTIRQDKNSIYKVRRYKSHKYHKYSDHFCRQFNLSFIHTSLFNYHFANFQKITLRLLTSFAIQRQCIFSIFLSVFTFLSIVRLWNFPRSFSNTVKSGI